MKISNAEVYQKTTRTSLTQHLGGSRGRTSENSAAQKQRAVKRRLQELQQENYKESKMDIPPTFIQGGLRPGKTVNTRRILGSKKTIANVFDDDPQGADLYFSLTPVPSKYPPPSRCTDCGYLSEANLKCGGSKCTTRVEKI